MSGGLKPMSVEIQDAIKADWDRNPWYRHGEALFNPSMADMRQPDAIAQHLVKGWAPPAPFIDPSVRVTLIGGCFCGALAAHLRTLNYVAPGQVDALFLPINETLCTTFALRQMFEWQFCSVKPDPGLVKGNRALEINFSDELWRPTLARLSDTDVFVLLVSSAEIWADAPTGAVLWRETPGANLERQIFRTSTAAENLANLREIHRLIRQHRPGAKVIYALSPIPMIATHRAEGAISANTVSKAAMRVSIDELYRETQGDGHSFYFPFYEVVLEGFGASPYRGHFNGDRRHVNDILFEHMMIQFEALYCDVARPSRSMFKDLVRSKVDTGDMTPDILQATSQEDRRALQHMVNWYVRHDDRPMAELVARYAAECLNLGSEPEPPSWTNITPGWQILPSLHRVGPAPQVLPIPATAWDYGATSDPIVAEGPGDLLVRLRLKILEGSVGVMLIRPDGSALSDHDLQLTVSLDEVSLELRLYPKDGPAHILLRNYDNEGVAGAVEVLNVATRPATPAITVG